MSLAIIMDMDGLMLDTEPLSIRAWQAAASDLGWTVDDEVCGRMIGLGAGVSRLLLLRHFGDEFPVDDIAEIAWRRYRTLLDEGGVPCKAGLFEFLDFLDERGLPRAVATSTRTEMAAHKLQQAGVFDRVGPIVGGDQVEHGKPSPDIFLMAAERLGRAPTDCVVLEDSAPGIEAAAAAGMRAILIPDGREPSPASRRLAYVVVDSLLDARAVIDRL